MHGKASGAEIADRLQDAGVGFHPGDPGRIVYDAAACVRILMERDGMTQDEADEFFDFNVAGAYVGEQTPLFIVTAPAMKGCP